MKLHCIFRDFNGREYIKRGDKSFTTEKTRSTTLKIMILPPKKKLEKKDFIKLLFFQ